MRTALVIGSGHTVHKDLVTYCGPVDGVVACNEAGTLWPRDLDAWVSLHCRYFKEKGWRQERADKGYPEAKRHFGHLEAFRGSLAQSRYLTPDIEKTDYRVTPEARSGSSGLFAAKVALIDLGFDRAVLCGIPMTPEPHFTGRDNWVRKNGSAEGFRRAWIDCPQSFLDRMRSMSGWTRILLGGPDHA